MSTHWHNQIQQFLDGQASAEETAALQQAMKADALLRNLYLDYVNLDLALSSMAELATILENEQTEKESVSPKAASELPISSIDCWRWPATAVVVLGLALMFSVYWSTRYSNTQRPSAATRSDVVRVCGQMEESVQQISIEFPTSFPTWISPTASILDQPFLPLKDPSS